MLKKLSLITLIKSVKDCIEKGTGLICYDEVPKNAIAPFYYAEVVGIRPSDSKTSYRDVATIWVHAIAEPKAGNTRIYELINNLEEAMTVDIVLPNGYDLQMQKNQGLLSLQKDETDEKHAVMGYEITICYGFKIK